MKLAMQDGTGPEAFLTAVAVNLAEGMVGAKAAKAAADARPMSKASWDSASPQVRDMILAHAVLEPDFGTVEGYKHSVDIASALGYSAGQSHAIVARHMPKSHQAWLDAGCP